MGHLYKGPYEPIETVMDPYGPRVGQSLEDTREHVGISSYRFRDIGCVTQIDTLVKPFPPLRSLVPKVPGIQYSKALGHEALCFVGITENL